MDEMARSEAKLGDYVKKDYKDFDRRYHVNGEKIDTYYISRNKNHKSSRLCVLIYWTYMHAITFCRK